MKQSPVSKKSTVETLDWFDAMRNVISGAWVTKKEWGDDQLVVRLEGERLSICTQPSGYAPVDWIVCFADMVGMDWVVVKEGSNASQSPSAPKSPDNSG